MKIIQIGAYPLDANRIKGGVESSVYGLVQEQVKTNEVFVIDVPRKNSIEDTVEQQDNNLRIARFYYKGTSNKASIKRVPDIVRTICDFEPEICHIHSTSLFSLVVFLRLKMLKIPVAFTIHGLAHIEKKNSYQKVKSFRNLLKYFIQSIAEFILLSSNKVVIVDTEYVADAVEKYWQQKKIWRKPICKVIPQGINARFFKIEDQHSSGIILSVGAISERKGYLFLIEAIALVKKQIPAVNLIIAGTLSQPNYYNILIKKIEDLQLKENVKIYVDADFKQILQFFGDAYLFALHSEEESQGIVFCEAMAAGKPVVATNVGGIPWVIKDKENGFLSSFKDVDMFAANIIHLLNSSDLRQKISRQNKSDAMRFSWELISKQIQEVYVNQINRNNF